MDGVGVLSGHSFKSPPFQAVQGVEVFPVYPTVQWQLPSLLGATTFYGAGVLLHLVVATLWPQGGLARRYFWTGGAVVLYGVRVLFTVVFIVICGDFVGGYSRRQCKTGGGFVT